MFVFDFFFPQFFNETSVHVEQCILCHKQSFQWCTCLWSCCVHQETPKLTLNPILSSALEKENALWLCVLSKKKISVVTSSEAQAPKLPHVLLQPLLPSRVKKQLGGKHGGSWQQSGTLRPGPQEDWKSGLVGSLGRHLKTQDNREHLTARQNLSASG